MFWKIIVFGSLCMWFGYISGKHLAKYPDGLLFYLGTNEKKYRMAMFGILLKK